MTGASMRKAAGRRAGRAGKIEAVRDANGRHFGWAGFSAAWHCGNALARPRPALACDTRFIYLP
ncbi:hypothetical protein [Methyloversatilis sp.]|uniref:hypothetical protein n=1 Tax=Methyloversatilis sp. TaxID=2569862 RepID=UPI0035B00FC5